MPHETLTLGHIQLTMAANAEAEARRFWGELVDLTELPKPAALAGRVYLYISSLTVGFIGLASEGETLSGIYQQLKDFRAKQKA